MEKYKMNTSFRKGNLKEGHSLEPLNVNGAII
jgi:hypothetical protein